MPRGAKVKHEYVGPPAGQEQRGWRPPFRPPPEKWAVWQRLLRSSNNSEAETIIAVAERAGILWRCEAPRIGDDSENPARCGWRNSEDDFTCDGCGAWGIDVRRAAHSPVPGVEEFEVYLGKKRMGVANLSKGEVGGSGAWIDGDGGSVETGVSSEVIRQVIMLAARDPKKDATLARYSWDPKKKLWNVYGPGSDEPIGTCESASEHCSGHFPGALFRYTAWLARSPREAVAKAVAKAG